MKELYKTSAIVAMVLFFVLTVGWSGEFNYASYHRTTLQSITTEEQKHAHVQAMSEKNADDIQLECVLFKYRVSCRYSDVRRPISEKKKNAILLWMETLRIDSQYASLYRQEIRVSEGKNINWIPIQEPLLPHIDNELVKDDSFELFIILIGQVDSEFVFIATEFAKPMAPAEASMQTAAGTRVTP